MQPRPVCDQVEVAKRSSAIVNVPGSRMKFTDAVPPAVVSVVVAEPCPESENAKSPLPPTVFLTTVSVPFVGGVVVPVGHSVAYVGIGHPMPERSTHFMYGPMSEVPVPDVPPVIASAITSPRPDEVLDPTVLFTASAIMLPRPGVLVDDVGVTSARIFCTVVVILVPLWSLVDALLPSIDTRPRMRDRALEKSPTSGSALIPGISGVLLAVCALAIADCASNANTSTPRNIVETVLFVRMCETVFIPRLMDKSY
jgi:hypothetical protein